MASFSIPYVPLNANSWGPPSDDPNDKKNRFYQLPYAPFGKSHVFTIQNYLYYYYFMSFIHEYKNNI